MAGAPGLWWSDWSGAGVVSAVVRPFDGGGLCWTNELRFHFSIPSFQQLKNSTDQPCPDTSGVDDERNAAPHISPRPGETWISQGKHTDKSYSDGSTCDTIESSIVLAVHCVLAVGYSNGQSFNFRVGLYIWCLLILPN